ncbi:GNAT family N-acetyltransferase [Sulfurimonas sp. HSL-3221]|uniref:GNAT family N-acetyltransferase n=1 Tax=Sulfurimonadaceae TaxID=2771471 RepID=UPI001E5F2274|nr:GNAT family N-acetyltransferase [Sulfurimonas sp. HSL-3221]UFS61821.1 GNAT family N-acetyltransferase [Sulfurimonas sp. HSL-3221]
MSIYQLVHLDRDAYLASIATITDPKSLGFAEQSLRWWDRHFSWKYDGCMVLSDTQANHLCYIFYKIDCYGDYLTIHNLFTPKPLQRHGYARQLLSDVFEHALTKHVRRFRCTCVPQSLEFYLSLGFAYWGSNTAKDYYCDLPMPSDGLEGVARMVNDADAKELMGKSEAIIRKKVCGHSNTMGEECDGTYKDDLKKMGNSYLGEALCLE